MKILIIICIIIAGVSWLISHLSAAYIKSDKLETMKLRLHMPTTMSMILGISHLIYLICIISFVILILITIIDKYL